MQPGRCPVPPSWVLDKSEALALWHQYAAALNRLGLLESLDAIAFGMLCDAVAGYMRIREELSDQELVSLIGDQCYPTVNPLCALMRGQTKAVRELLSDFGMTPSSRSSLTGSTSVEPRGDVDLDPLAALLEELNRPLVTLPAPKRKPTTKKPAKRKRPPIAK